MEFIITYRDDIVMDVKWEKTLTMVLLITFNALLYLIISKLKLTLFWIYLYQSEFSINKSVLYISFMNDNTSIYKSKTTLKQRFFKAKSQAP